MLSLPVVFGYTVQAKPQAPLFKVVGFYSDTVEQAHMEFAHAAIGFYRTLAAQKNFQFDSTKDWKNNCNYAYMSQYNVVLWLNLFCYTTAQQTDFQKYIENGGAWMGFHASGYYDNSMNWPWEQTFIHQGNYCKNNWPPATVKLITDDQTHPATLRLAKKWTGPVNEYYQWCPSPRLNADIRVLISIDPTVLPFGNGDGQHASDVIPAGVDVPVVWTNTKFSRMIYSVMGHGAGAIGTDTNMSHLLTDAIMWLGSAATNVKNIGISRSGSDGVYAMNVRTSKQYVSVRMPGEMTLTATISDPLGRTISKSESNGSGQCVLDRSRSGKGVYFVRVVCPTGTFSQCLILN